ncbi:MAG: sugar phosphate nucleotidyltransferase, partial [Aeromicrobium sp.]|uniref:sugar phosphate nucleotidyltransferase n=1 Tax=Aeromicrobium sp. TaxID=1871063 RepID=UPI003C5AA250
MTSASLDSFHAIIPAGGAGTRLWPLSRRAHPKFLLDVDGSGRTLVQQTWDRLSQLIPPDRIWIVTGAAHADSIGEQLP